MIYLHFIPFFWGCRICRLHLCRGITSPLPTMRLPVSCGWQLVMLEDRILVAEQFVTWQLKRSCDSQLSTYWARWAAREVRSDQSAGHVCPLLNLCKHPNKDDGCRVNHAVERLIALSIPGQVVILGIKTQGQNIIV